MFIHSDGVERVWRVGDLAPDELEEIGPDAEPPSMPNPAWTREQYRTQMILRGVKDSDATHALGFDGYLKLAEEVGVLEKRPNTCPGAVPQQREAVS